jgi:hypothetical protein
VNKDQFFPPREEYKSLVSRIIPFTIFATIHEEPFPIPYDCGICQDGTNACTKKYGYLSGTNGLLLTV